MKKILSTFLSLAIILTTVLSIPFATSAIITPNAGYNDPVEIFNSANSTNANWLEYNGVPFTNNGVTYTGDNWKKSVNNTTIAEGGVTEPILENNECEISSVKDFVWEFDYKTVAWGRSAFWFHVNDDSEITNINNASCATNKNVFGIVFLNRNNKTAGQYTLSGILRPMAMTVVVPNAETGVVEPLDATYYSKGGSDGNYGEPATKDYTNTGSTTLAGENGFLSLVGLTEFADVTWHIKIELVGKELTLTVSETGKTTLSKTFTLPTNLYSLTAGDFAISHGNNKGSYSNMTVKNITAKEKTDGLIFDSTDLDEEQYDWIDNANSSAVNGSSTVGTDSYDSTYGAIKLPNYYASKPILEDNGYTDTNLTDFVWEVEYMTTDPKWANVSFLFHVNDKRENNKSTLPTTSTGEGGVKYVMGVSLTGFGVGASNVRNPMSLSVCAPASDGAYRSALYVDTTVISKLELQKNYKIADTTANDSYFAKGKFVTLRMTYSGGNLYVEIWETDNKAATYQKYYYGYGNEHVERAPSGDFAIRCGNTPCYIKNMKIYKGTETSEFADSEFTKYDGYETVYNFDTMPEDLYAGASNTGTITHDAENGTLKITALEASQVETGRDQVAWLGGIDGSNDNLGDFIMKFDWTDSSNWTNFRVNFRIQESGTDYYSLWFKKNGNTVSADTTKHHTISILKYTDDVYTTLATVPVVFSLLRERMNTFMLKAVGDTIEVYISGEGSSINIPLITVTDDTYTAGSINMRQTKQTVTLDNIEIYDITAYNAAQTINEGTSDVKRGMDDEILNLRMLYLGLHASQKAKLAEQIAALDEAKAKLDDIEFKAHDANGSCEIDIRDLVALRNAIVANESAETVDPVFDGILNADDIAKIRDMVLNDDAKKKFLQ